MSSCARCPSALSSLQTALGAARTAPDLRATAQAVTPAFPGAPAALLQHAQVRTIWQHSACEYVLAALLRLSRFRLYGTNRKHLVLTAQKSLAAACAKQRATSICMPVQPARPAAASRPGTAPLSRAADLGRALAARAPPQASCRAADVGLREQNCALPFCKVASSGAAQSGPRKAAARDCSLSSAHRLRELLVLPWLRAKLLDHPCNRCDLGTNTKSRRLQLQEFPRYWEKATRR